MNCEDARLSAMALRDGEPTAFERTLVEAHVAGCADCQRDLAELAQVDGMWAGISRQAHDADLWSAIEARLAAEQVPTASPSTLQGVPRARMRAEQSWTRRKAMWVASLAAALATFRVAEFVPDRSLGFWIQLVPLVVGLAVFAILGQNPFQISTTLEFNEEES